MKYEFLCMAWMFGVEDKILGLDVDYEEDKVG